MPRCHSEVTVGSRPSRTLLQVGYLKPEPDTVMSSLRVPHDGKCRTRLKLVIQKSDADAHLLFVSREVTSYRLSCENGVSYAATSPRSRVFHFLRSDSIRGVNRASLELLNS